VCVKLCTHWLPDHGQVWPGRNELQPTL
jgi:hypothetical protein